PTVNKLSLDIPRNSRIALLGHSGAGKSTLLHLLGLLDNPDPNSDSDIVYNSGAECFSYFGRKAKDVTPLASESDRAWLRRVHFGFVFQEGHLLEHLGCLDNVGVGLSLAGQAGDTKLRRCRQLLQSVGMEEFEGQKVRELSGGEKQRISVLRAI